MKTVEIIRNLSDKQIQTAFIVLGVYFSKNDKLYNPSEGFEVLSKQGLNTLEEEGIVLPNEFTAGQIKDLLKIEMVKKGLNNPTGRSILHCNKT